VQLVTDYIHPIPRGGRCRVRVHLLDEDVDGPVVVCSELPTNAFEQLAAAQVRERPRCCRGDSLGGEEAGMNERGGPSSGVSGVVTLVQW